MTGGMARESWLTTGDVQGVEADDKWLLNVSHESISQLVPHLPVVLEALQQGQPVIL